MNNIWKQGIDLLAKTAERQRLQGSRLSFPETAELLDKLLVGTGECQAAGEIAEYLQEQHGWDEGRAGDVAELYAVVDAVRTSGRPQGFFWGSDLDEVLAVVDQPGGSSTTQAPRTRQQNVARKRKR